ncbi:MAG: M15 family metallopeptidase [Acidimicrobiales bacterium]|nr:M15 family metallopeptidase [Acidimicrobiales bacterium]
MAADNTSAFDCRTVVGTSTLSRHAPTAGRSISTPWRTPTSAGSSVDPPAGRAYTNRSDRRPGMVLSGDPVVSVFAAIGWEWGGDWSSAKDYQHFSLTGR